MEPEDPTEDIPEEQNPIESIAEQDCSKEFMAEVSYKITYKKFGDHFCCLSRRHDRPNILAQSMQHTSRQTHTFTIKKLGLLIIGLFYIIVCPG